MLVHAAYVVAISLSDPCPRTSLHIVHLALTNCRAEALICGFQGGFIFQHPTFSSVFGPTLQGWQPHRQVFLSLLSGRLD